MTKLYIIILLLKKGKCSFDCILFFIIFEKGTNPTLYYPNTIAIVYVMAINMSGYGIQIFPHV